MVYLIVVLVKKVDYEKCKTGDQSPVEENHENQNHFIIESKSNEDQSSQNKIGYENYAT